MTRKELAVIIPAPQTSCPVSCRDFASPPAKCITGGSAPGAPVARDCWGNWNHNWWLGLELNSSPVAMRWERCSWWCCHLYFLEVLCIHHVNLPHFPQPAWVLSSVVLGLPFVSSSRDDIWRFTECHFFIPFLSFDFRQLGSACAFSAWGHPGFYRCTE